MPHVNDCKRAKLLTRLARTDGHIDDLERDWLAAQTGVTAGQINDMWDQYLTAQSVAAGQLNDRFYAWLSGITGAPSPATLSDLWYWYWCVYTDPADPAEPDMGLINICLINEGWPAVYDGADTITITLPAGTVTLTRTLLLSCDFSSLPDPVANDVNDCMRAQGYCL